MLSMQETKRLKRKREELICLNWAIIFLSSGQAERQLSYCGGNSLNAMRLE